MTVTYWEEEIETLPRVGLESIQLRRLQHLVARVYKTVAPYRAKMDEAGVKPEDIQSLADLQKLPFTVKNDLRDNYPFGLFTVPLDEVVRIHASSGTTGKPTVVGYTRKDIELWASIMARALCCAGATREDMVQNAYGYGLFTGGLGAHYGIERLGATVIPVSGGNSKRQITLMRDFKSTVLLSTPSYALNLADAMDSMDIDPSSLSLRVGIFGAEPWSENMREEVERKLNLRAVDIYGLSEVMGPGVAQECLHSNMGMHIFEDHFLPEIIFGISLRRGTQAADTTGNHAVKIPAESLGVSLDLRSALFDLLLFLKGIAVFSRSGFNRFSRITDGGHAVIRGCFQ